MVSCAATNNPTLLHIALGIVTREKQILNCYTTFVHRHMMTCYISRTLEVMQQTRTKRNSASMIIPMSQIEREHQEQGCYMY